MSDPSRGAGRHDADLEPLCSPLPRSPILDREEPELAHEDDIPTDEGVQDDSQRPAAPGADTPERPPADAATDAVPADDEGVWKGVAKELGILPPQG